MCFFDQLHVRCNLASWALLVGTVVLMKKAGIATQYPGTQSKGMHSFYSEERLVLEPDDSSLRTLVPLVKADCFYFLLLFAGTVCHQA